MLVKRLNTKTSLRSTSKKEHKRFKKTSKQPRQRGRKQNSKLKHLESLRTTLNSEPISLNSNQEWERRKLNLRLNKSTRPFLKKKTLPGKLKTMRTGLKVKNKKMDHLLKDHILKVMNHMSFMN